MGLVVASLAGACAARPLPIADNIRPSLNVANDRITLAPLDYVRFCMQRSAECKFEAPNSIILVTAEILSALDRVNRGVNRRIQPKSDVTEWRINPPYGNCNDYVVTKRHELIKMGLPASALLITSAKTTRGEGHLLLVVRTDRGEMVLDNLTSEIHYRHETDYTWIKRQSSRNPAVWELI